MLEEIRGRAIERKRAAEAIEAVDMGPREMAGVIDNTLLAPDATTDYAKEFLARSGAHPFAGVVLPPAFVELARGRVPQETRLISVVGFPLGNSRLETKMAEAQALAERGCQELDMVASIWRIKERDWRGLAAEVEAVVSAAGVPVKVIIECGLLMDEEKAEVARVLLDSGAAMVKTSTGFLAGGATLYDVALLAEATGGRLPVKASGGIRTPLDVVRMLAAGASRIGTSKGVEILETLENERG